MNARKSLEHDPKNWGFCDMKKEKCQHDSNGQATSNDGPYSKDLLETKLRMLKQRDCQVLFNKQMKEFKTDKFNKTLELCATGIYTLQARRINRSKKQWKKGKLEKPRTKRGRCFIKIYYCIRSRSF